MLPLLIGRWCPSQGQRKKGIIGFLDLPLGPPSPTRSPCPRATLALPHPPLPLFLRQGPRLHLLSLSALSFAWTCAAPFLRLHCLPKAEPRELGPVAAGSRRSWRAALPLRLLLLCWLCGLLCTLCCGLLLSPAPAASPPSPASSAWSAAWRAPTPCARASHQPLRPESSVTLPAFLSTACSSDEDGRARDIRGELGLPLCSEVAPRAERAGVPKIPLYACLFEGWRPPPGLASRFCRHPGGEFCRPFAFSSAWPLSTGRRSRYRRGRRRGGVPGWHGPSHSSRGHGRSHPPVHEAVRSGDRHRIARNFHGRTAPLVSSLGRPFECGPAVGQPRDHPFALLVGAGAGRSASFWNCCREKGSGKETSNHRAACGSSDGSGHCSPGANGADEAAECSPGPGRKRSPPSSGVSCRAPAAAGLRHGRRRVWASDSLDLGPTASSSINARQSSKREKLQQELALRFCVLPLNAAECSPQDVSCSACAFQCRGSEGSGAPLSGVVRFGGYAYEKDLGLVLLLLAYVGDALAQGDVRGAQEHIALAMMSVEQAACDGGKWDLAFLLSLVQEPSPTLFQARPSSGQQSQCFASNRPGSLWSIDRRFSAGPCHMPVGSQRLLPPARRSGRACPHQQARTCL